MQSLPIHKGQDAQTHGFAGGFVTVRLNTRAPMASSANPATSGAKPNPKQLQQVVFGLNQLRSEQRQLSQKVLELDADLNEHRLVG